MRRAHFGQGKAIEYPEPKVLAVDSQQIVYSAGGRVFGAALDTCEYLWWTDHSTFLRGLGIVQSTVAGTLWRELSEDWRELIGVSTIDGGDRWSREVPPGNIHIHCSRDKFIVESDYALSAIEANSGDLAWTIPYESWDQQPVIDGNYLFAVSFVDGVSSKDEVSTLTVLDIDTGTPLWSKSYKRGGLLTVHPGNDGIVVINAEGWPDDTYSSFQSGARVESGTVLWERPFPGQMEFTTCTRFGDICVTSYASDERQTFPLEVTSNATGEVIVRWEDDTILRQLSLKAGTILAARYTHTEPDPPVNTLVSLNLRTGQFEWEADLADQHLHAQNLVLFEDSLLVASPQGIKCLDLSTGRTLGELELELGPRYEHGMYVASERIVVSDGKNLIHVLPMPTFKDEP